jgi:ElaB/YqjD/DUF883 family membrane-anchored ribosome-binding protein
MDTSSSRLGSEGGSRVGGLAEELNDRLKDASAGLRDIDEQARAFIKESPFVALAAAVAGGFLLGRLLSKL